MRRAFRRYVVEGFLGARAADLGAEGAFSGGLLFFWVSLDVFERFRAEYREYR